MNLREILGMQTPKPRQSEFEIMARNLVRQLTLMGYGAYEIWEITNQMEQYALSAQDHPDLFPPNQKPPRLVGFHLR